MKKFSSLRRFLFLFVFLIFAGVSVNASQVVQAAAPQQVTQPILACETVENVSPAGTATQSSGFQGNRFPATLAIDGNLGNFTHTAAGQSNAQWQLDFTEAYLLDEIVLHNRDNCCQSRLRDITVRVLNAAGEAVYTSPLLNTENTLNSPEQLRVTLPNNIVGNTVIVQRTPDADLSGQSSAGKPSDADVLSLAEVEVLGCQHIAQQITWSAPINTTDKAQLITGNVIYAVNGGDSLTIQNAGATQQTIQFSGVTYPQLTFSEPTTSATFTNAGATPTGDVNFDKLLNTFTWASAEVTKGTQTIGGLTAGNTYQIQVFYNDQRTPYADRMMTFASTAPPAQSVTLHAKGTGRGQHAIGTFVATSNEMQLQHITNGFKNVHFNAMLIVEPLSQAGTVNVTLNGDTVATSQTLEVFLTFSEEVTGLTVNDFKVTNGTVTAVSGTGRYYTATLTANAPGVVTVRLPANKVRSLNSDAGNSASAQFTVTTDFHTGANWTIDTQAQWTAAQASKTNLTLQDGQLATTDQGVFHSVVHTFNAPQKLDTITFSQTADWNNWIGVSNVGPSDGRDAPVLLPIGPDNYYFLALGNTGGYHAWHSTDMQNWTHRGPVTPPGDGRWVTSAEYKDGKTYIYSDAPNDMTPHLFVDENLDDGVPGEAMGPAFTKPSCGSDASFFRNDTDGLFHIIYEDWSPINARQNSWDSPLAGHATSADGLTGFEHHEHLPPVDHRTTPTGVIKNYSHPFVTAPCEYEEHLPAQDAYGDWTTIKVGDQYHLFADYDQHAGGIKVGRFTSDSIFKEFELVGSLGNGHPDPTVGFAEGQFYLVTQQSTDYVSPGPWVDGVEARVGVDTNNDGRIDQWTAWQSIQETYSLKPGYARVVETAPAQIDASNLPSGYGFKFSFRLDNSVVTTASPVMDKVVLNFSAP